MARSNNEQYSKPHKSTCMHLSAPEAISCHNTILGLIDHQLLLLNLVDFGYTLLNLDLLDQVSQLLFLLDCSIFRPEYSCLCMSLWPFVSVLVHVSLSLSLSLSLCPSLPLPLSLSLCPSNRPDSHLYEYCTYQNVVIV